MVREHGPYLSKVLQFDGQEIGAAYGAFAIGAMVSPFFVGLVADRYFASEKMLGALGLLGGVILCLLPEARSFESFYPLLILYCALYVPTLALGNSLALHHLRDSKRDFPRVKSLSAVGWIAGGVTLSLIKGEQPADQFYLAGGPRSRSSLPSFTLPHTPPRKVARERVDRRGSSASTPALLKKRSFAVFVGCMF